MANLHPAQTRDGLSQGGVAAPPAARLRLLDAISSVLDVSADLLTDESSPQSIVTWDSLNHLNVAMAVEGEFGVALTPDEVMEMANIGLIAAVLRRHGVDL